MKEKEIYREKIKNMLNKIESTCILEYIYIIIRDIVREVEGKKHG